MDSFQDSGRTLYGSAQLSFGPHEVGVFCSIRIEQIVRQVMQ